jgi:hypothetical protein
VAATGTSCARDGEEKCVSCDNLYRLYSNECFLKQSDPDTPSTTKPVESITPCYWRFDETQQKWVRCTTATTTPTTTTPRPTPPSTTPTLITSTITPCWRFDETQQKWVRCTTATTKPTTTTPRATPPSTTPTLITSTPTVDFCGTLPTKSVRGNACRQWNSVTRGHKTTKALDNLASSTGLNHNYCALVFPKETRPWCYVNSPRRWEYCGRTSVESVYDNKLKTCLPNTADPPRTTPREDCSNTQTETEDGYPCEIWTDVENQNQSYMNAIKPLGTDINHNYCRNPFNELTPWCYISNPKHYNKRWQKCAKPLC